MATSRLTVIVSAAGCAWATAGRSLALANANALPNDERDGQRAEHGGPEAHGAPFMREGTAAAGAREAPAAGWGGSAQPATQSA